MTYNRISFLCALAAMLSGCQSANETTPEMAAKYPVDAHSFSRPYEVAITSMHLDLKADFLTETLTGYVQYNLERNSGDSLVLDMKGMTIHKVTTPEGISLPYSIENGNAWGDKLVIQLGPDLLAVEVHYTTSPAAEALFWTPANQTNDGTAPFLFTQGQAILTRTWIPIQDTPSIRITYTAKITAPKGMMALMSAPNPTAMDPNGVYEFVLDKPVPPYLLALAVGDLRFKSVGSRTGVYAEPGMVDKAANEFTDMEKMLSGAESLYGPYAWGRYDVLVLPASFPFGGMENPVLTFATPTIIVGDRSLTSLIAHELAHSWSGNLVTNATWNDFWLNEGFTVYFENRIMEALYGRDYADMLAVLGYQDLLETVEDFGAESPDTHLKLELDGRNPDDGMTDIAYEKGHLFLTWLESLAGRERFDAFLKTYFSSHAFRTMTTEDFIGYLDKHLLAGIQPRPDIESWIYKPGLPEGHPEPVSSLFQKVDSARMQWESGRIAAAAMPTGQWSTHEWLHLLRGISDTVSVARLTELDEAFSFTGSPNSEIAAAWYLIAIKADYRQAFPEMRNFLLAVGRRKFLKPIYDALSKNEEHAMWAKDVYTEARPRYHAVSVHTIDAILKYTPPA